MIGVELRPWMKTVMALLVAGVVMGMTPQEAGTLLRQGIGEYGAKQFVTAKQTLMKLQQNRDELSEQERMLLDEHMLRIDKAIKEQAVVLKKLSEADASRQAGHLPEAAKLYAEVQLAANLLPDAVLDRVTTAQAEIKKAQAPARIAAEEAQAASKPAAEPAKTDETMKEEAKPVAEETKKTETKDGATVVESTKTTVTEKTEPLAAATPQPAEVAPAGQMDLSLPVEASPAPSTMNTLAGEYQIVRAIKEQRARKLYNDQIDKLKANVAQNRFELARGDLQYAKQIIEANRRYFDPVSGFDELKASADQDARYIDQSEQTFDKENAAAMNKSVAEAVATRTAEAAKVKAMRKKQLMDQAMQLKRERRYAEAAQKLNEILSIDPTDEKVLFMREALDELVRYNESGDIKRKKNEFQQDLLNETEAAMVSSTRIVTFPKNWKEIARSREAYGADEAKEDQQTREIKRKLKSIIPEFKFQEVPLEQVITLLQDITGLNISVDWKALEASNITKETPVSANLRDIPVENAIDLMLKDLSGADIKLGFEIQGGVIRISTKAVLDQNLTVKVYDISDMVTTIPDFTDAPELQLTTTGGGAGGGAALFGGGAAAAEPEASSQERADEIVTLITETVLKDSWSAAGGTANIKKLGPQLIVTQTARGQAEVANLLKQLRESRAVQVNIECRFLEVRNNFLEEIGVDLDIVLNQSNPGYDRTNLANNYYMNAYNGGAYPGGTNVLMPRANSSAGFLPSVPGGPASPIALGQGLTPAAPRANQPYYYAGLVPQQSGPSWSDFTPIPILQNSLALTNPANLNSIVSNSYAGPNSVLAAAGPAFAIAGSFLDGLQVDFLVRATQADQRSSILQAPRLTLYNGQRAWVAVLTEQSYISDLTPVVAENVAAYDPTISAIYSGSVLDVQATVSSDRKFVTMTLRPSTANVVAYQTFLVQTAGPNTLTSGSASLSLPVLQRQVVKTTVTVPDGGTLLLGGQKLAQETEVEAGVPVLSKIPVIKRAFDNRSVVKDEDTLIILVKPTIIIIAEEEQKEVAPLSGGI